LIQVLTPSGRHFLGWGNTLNLYTFAAYTNRSGAFEHTHKGF